MYICRSDEKGKDLLKKIGRAADLTRSGLHPTGPAQIRCSLRGRPEIQTPAGPGGQRDAENEGVRAISAVGVSGDRRPTLVVSRDRARRRRNPSSTGTARELTRRPACRRRARGSTREVLRCSPEVAASPGVLGIVGVDGVMLRRWRDGGG